MIIEDWKRLVDNQKVTNQSGAKTYLHHNGKPVVAIWGVGFPDRPYNIRNIGMERLIDFLQNDPVYGGCTVMLGVPTFWRTLESDCMNDPYLHTLIRKADIVCRGLSSVSLRYCTMIWIVFVTWLLEISAGAKRMGRLCSRRNSWVQLA